jgi:transcriptional regulator GlxA family with amidase domain
VIVAFPDVQVLDVVGPLEVLSRAADLAPDHDPGYAIEVVTADGRPVRATCGIQLGADSSVGDCRGPIDTLMVAGGAGTRAVLEDTRLVDWVRRAARRSRRVTSVCSGAFVLARAGLLDGRRATTHWSVCDLLGRVYPDVTVEADRIYVRDGDVWTSAGVTAGMDLALALVEDDLGADVAREVARWLVLFVQRPGGQAQFSAQLAAQNPERVGLRELARWIPDHLTDDLSVAALAAHAGMSARNLARAFRRELGTTPASYVESLRVEAARRLLETTDLGVATVAARCGFGTVETMHRTFKRALSVTPGEYRRHFRTRATA